MMMGPVGMVICLIALFVSLACVVGAARMVQFVRNSGTITLLVGFSTLTLSLTGALIGGLAPSFDYWESVVIVAVVLLGLGSLGLLLCLFGGLVICVKYLATVKRLNELGSILAGMQQRMEASPSSSSTELKS